MSLALRLDHVSFAYTHGTPVLRDVDLEVQRGEFVAIAGPNAAGKTTWLRLVPGLERPTSGRVEVLLHRFGYLPQRAQTGIDAPLTVRELVAVGRVPRTRLFGPLGQGDREVVREAIDRVGLTRQPTGVSPLSQAVSNNAPSSPKPSPANPSCLRLTSPPPESTSRAKKRLPACSVGLPT